MQNFKTNGALVKYIISKKDEYKKKSYKLTKVDKFYLEKKEGLKEYYSHGLVISSYQLSKNTFRYLIGGISFVYDEEGFITQCEILKNENTRSYHFIGDTNLDFISLYLQCRKSLFDFRDSEKSKKNKIENLKNVSKSSKYTQVAQSVDKDFVVEYTNHGVFLTNKNKSFRLEIKKTKNSDMDFLEDKKYLKELFIRLKPLVNMERDSFQLPNRTFIQFNI